MDGIAFNIRGLTEEERKRSKLDVDERTQATYYKSDRYPDGLTPEHVQGATARKHKLKNGQVPWPMNRWTPYDPWYPTNNWFHKINDRVPFALFTGFCQGLHNHELYDQPYKGHLNYSERKYDDNILAQTLGGAMIGLQLGFGFGILHTYNLSKAANIYTTLSMRPSTWMPINKGDFRFKRRVIGSCMIQCASFLAGFQLVDGLCSKFRDKDDLWNPLLGGIASGCVLYAWFRNPFMTIPAGFFFGCYMTWFRFFATPDGMRKTAFDVERPFWGVFGGMRYWIWQLEPNVDQYVWQFWDPKYRTS